MLKSLSIIPINRKLQSKTGDKIKKGVNILAVATYNKAGKKVDLPNKLYLFTTLFKYIACNKVMMTEINTFILGDINFRCVSPIKFRTAGSNIEGFSSAGILMNALMHNIKARGIRKIKFKGVKFLNCFIMI
jgi:hypothetical protein